MAKLHITEFSNLQNAVGVGHAQESAQLPMLPPVAQQVVTFTTTTQSAALNSSTRFVRLIADADCHIEVGANPTATTSGMKLIAGAAEYFGVTPGHKIAAVTAS